MLGCRRSERWEVSALARLVPRHSLEAARVPDEALGYETRPLVTALVLVGLGVVTSIVSAHARVGA